jgi:SAM-dependent methyltransferase
MDFYDALTPLYHLIYPNWEDSIQRQGEQLDQIIQTEWPGHNTVLDVSCGIGTQTLALAQRDYAVTASDLSPKEIERARYEAQNRGTRIDFKVADMRAAHDVHGTGFDLVISGDNSVPHLLTDADLLLAFQQFLACLRPGGGCLISVRDYDQEARGSNIVKPYGARVQNGKRHVLFQIWDFDQGEEHGYGDHYDLSFYVIEDDLSTGQAHTHVMRSRYYAISTTRLCELMREAGFESVHRLDGVFFQPVLVGTKPVTA